MQRVGKHDPVIAVIPKTVVVYHLGVLPDAGQQEIKDTYHIQFRVLKTLLAAFKGVAQRVAGIIDHTVVEIALLGALHLDSDVGTAFGCTVDVVDGAALIRVVWHLLLRPQGDTHYVLVWQDAVNQHQQQILLAMRSKYKLEGKVNLKVNVLDPVAAGLLHVLFVSGLTVFCVFWFHF